MEEVPKTQYLMRRGGRYSIRMRVPKDLLEAYAPTKEICRTPTARRKADEVRTLHASGIGPVEIAKRLGIGRSSVYRVLEGTRI